MKKASQQARFSEILIYRNNFLLIIGSAVLADTMREHELAAFRARNQIDRLHLPVGSALVAAPSGGFIFRTDRHGYFPP